MLLTCITGAGSAFAQNRTWSFPAGGQWENSSNWLGGVPQGDVGGDILIRPDFGGEIDGPVLDVFANNFTLGADVGTTTLVHYRAQWLAFTGQTTIEAGGRLEIRSATRLFGSQGGISNAGEVRILGGTINAGPFANTGIIRGYGEIGAPVVNSGRIELFDQPSELVFHQTVTNQAGGLIAVRDTNLRISGGLANQGAVSVSDGTVDLFAEINNAGSIGLSGGSSVSLVGNLIQNGAVNLLAGSRLTVFGDFSGAGGTAGPGLLEVLGTMSVGNSPANVNFGGDVSLGVSTFIELSGVDDGDFDALTVFGSISLGGELDVSLLNGFEPKLGDIFEIVTSGAGITGDFTVGSIPDLGPTLTLRPSYTPTSVVLAVVPAIAGDYNADGSVDAADYTMWRNALGQSGAGLVADGDGDNQVDADDYDVWKSNFGQISGSGSGDTAISIGNASSNVPEPAALLLLLMGCVAAGLVRVSRRVD